MRCGDEYMCVPIYVQNRSGTIHKKLVILISPGENGVVGRQVEGRFLTI